MYIFKKIYYVTIIHNIKYNNAHIYIYIYIYTQVNIFKIHTVCVCIYIYIINKHSTHILCKQKLLFWIQLIAINHLTALLKT